jgi:hypothetical protein
MGMGGKRNRAAALAPPETARKSGDMPRSRLRRMASATMIGHANRRFHRLPICACGRTATSAATDTAQAGEMSATLVSSRLVLGNQWS